LPANARLIIVTDVTIILSTVVSSLIGLEHWDRQGVAIYWSSFCGAGSRDVCRLGCPRRIATGGEGAAKGFAALRKRRHLHDGRQRYQYRLVPDRAPFGRRTQSASDHAVAHLSGEHSAALFLNLMRGLLEGSRRLAGPARRASSFVNSSDRFCGSVARRAAGFIYSYLHADSAQTCATLLARVAVWIQAASAMGTQFWIEFKNSMRYGSARYPGGVGDFTTLVWTNLMLGAMAAKRGDSGFT